MFCFPLTIKKKKINEIQQRESLIMSYLNETSVDSTDSLLLQHTHQPKIAVTGNVNYRFHICRRSNQADK